MFVVVTVLSARRISPTSTAAPAVAFVFVPITKLSDAVLLWWRQNARSL